MKKISNISKTINTAWKRRLVSAAPVVAGLLAFTTSAHATVFDAIGHYMYSGFTGPLVKAIAVVFFIISIIGIRNGEGRAFSAAVVAALISGAVLAAPLLVNEFGSAVQESPMPLDQYAPDVQGVTDSQWFRRILGAAVALFSIYLAIRQHDVNKRLVLSVGFGLALILNADAIIAWLR
ncbi:MAG: hypothetical protein ACJ73N_00565 [Bryobacteraceae bacterium]